MCTHGVVCACSKGGRDLGSSDMSSHDDFHRKSSKSSCHQQREPHLLIRSANDKRVEQSIRSSLWTFVKQSETLGAPRGGQ